MIPAHWRGMDGKGSPKNSLAVISIWLASACFINSFLMFLVQPMVAKAILPAFGGSAAVWTGVMLFFQSALVLGYGLAHWMRMWTGWTLVGGYGSFLILALVGCRLTSLLSVEPGSHPTWSVLAALAVAVGIPFLLVSVTTPIIQVLFFRAAVREPYWLYGVSNVASILALFLYPVVFEPTGVLTTHMTIWKWTLAGNGLLLTVAALLPQIRLAGRVAEDPVAAPTERTESGAGTGKWKAAWFAYPFLASVALLAFTTHLTIDVAPVPLLWVLPLGFYLLTYVLVFAPRPLVFPRTLAALALVACLLQSIPYLGWGQGPAIVVLPVALLCLFVICWFCHGRLSLSRPHASGLTRFYFSLSVGGAAGGVFTGLIAPAIFPDYYEFPLLLVVISGLSFVVLALGASAYWRSGKAPLAARAMTAVLFALTLSLNVLWFGGADGEVVLSQRNFYGSLRVHQTEQLVQMVSGRISHGIQVRPPGDPMTPTAYFHQETVLPAVFDATSGEGGRRIAILGLGAGTLAVYAEPGDTMRFIEINPLVGDMAHSHFSFMEQARGEVELDIGDGRKRLREEEPGSMDIIMVDAFTGDSVPVHLLTLEAYQEYISTLSPGGFLVYNISNRHLDLAKLMVGLAESNGWALRLVKCRPFPPHGNEAHYAVFHSEDSTMPDFSGDYRKVLTENEWPEPALWTDQFSNLLGVLKIKL